MITPIFDKRFHRLSSGNTDFYLVITLMPL